MADLQTLINAIPDAQDGNVITSDYHNTIKTALEAIAGQLGGTTSGQSATLTTPPNFLPNGKNTQWIVTLGAASDSGSAISDGWLPLYLPEGAVIQSMTVNGARVNAITAAFASLVVQPVTASDVTTLILIDLAAGGNPFNLTRTPAVPGLGPAALQDLATVKNSNNKYLVHAEVIGSTAAASVLIFSISISYTTP